MQKVTILVAVIAWLGWSEPTPVISLHLGMSNDVIKAQKIIFILLVGKLIIFSNEWERWETLRT